MQQERVCGVVSRWMLMELGVCFGMWQRYVDVQHTMRRCIAGLLQGMLMRAMHEWHERALELKHEKELLVRVATNLWAQRLGRGFRAWHERALELKHEKELLVRVATNL